MTLRMKRAGRPHHANFYKDHHFGACIGYSDYVALIILDHDCVETVTIGAHDPVEPSKKN